LRYAKSIGADSLSITGLSCRMFRPLGVWRSEVLRVCRAMGAVRSEKAATAEASVGSRRAL